MKKHKRTMRAVLSFLSAFVMMSANMSWAHAYSESTSVSNKGRVGAVDIELHQRFPEEQVMITPGQEVPLASFVENKGQPAWIRIKLEYPAPDEGLKELDDSLITFANRDWEKIGPYYYLKEAVGKNDSVQFTKSVRFPSDWDEGVEDGTLGMSFTAEAIQERNFTPDFSSDDPWHGAVIEAFDSDGYEAREEGTEQFSVVYKDGAEGLVCLGEDFFSNWGDLMAGDELEGEAVIKNRMNFPVKLYFGMKNQGDEDILKALHIRITNGDDVVYDGPLTGSVEPAVMLQEYQTGESSTFRYQIFVPKELNNSQAMADFDVIWSFSAQEILPEETPSIIEIIKTGEHNVLIGVAGASAVAVSACVLLVRRRKEGGQ